MVYYDIEKTLSLMEKNDSEEIEKWQLFIAAGVGNWALELEVSWCFSAKYSWINQSLKKPQWCKRSGWLDRFFNLC